MAFSREPQTNYPNYQDSAGHTEAVVWCLEQRCLPTALSVLGKGHSCLRTHPAPGADPAEKITWQIQVKQIKPSVGKFPSSPPPSDCLCDHKHVCASARRAQQARGPRFCSKLAANFLHFPMKPIKRKTGLSSCRDVPPALQKLHWHWGPPQPQPRLLLLQTSPQPE